MLESGNHDFYSSILTRILTRYFMFLVKELLEDRQIWRWKSRLLSTLVSISCFIALASEAKLNPNSGHAIGAFMLGGCVAIALHSADPSFFGTPSPEIQWELRDEITLQE